MQVLFPALDVVLEAPGAMPGRRQKQVQPIAIEQFSWAIAWARIANRRVRELNRGTASKNGLLGVRA